MSNVTLSKTSPNLKAGKSQARKPNNLPKPRKVADVSGKVQAVFSIPHCAMDYMSALAAPFETPPGVCIPAEVFPLPSQKIKTFLKGRFQAGTTGVGFINVSPVVTNSGAVIVATQATSVGVEATQFNAFTNTVSLTMPQLPWDETTRAAGGYQSRIVSYGLRVKYIGKLMDRNGVTTALEEPDHRNMYSSPITMSSLDKMNASAYSSLKRVGGELWDAEIFYSGPVSPDEVEFANAQFPLGQYIATIAIQGVPGDSYEFEYVQHTEVIGTLAVARTPSHSDPATFGKVLEAAKATAITGPLDSAHAPSFFTKFMEGAQQLGPAIMSAGRMIPALLSGAIPQGLLEAASLSKHLTAAFGALRPMPAIRGSSSLALGM